MPDAAADTSLRRRAGRFAAESGVISLLTTAIFVAIYRPWGDRLRVPISYGHDSLFYAMVIRSLDRYGRYAPVPTLGAPFDQNLYDFPQGADRLDHVIWRFLGIFTDDPFLVLNVFYALSFVLIAVAAYAVLRHLRIGVVVAGAVSILFAYLPYHFWRSIQHPNLAAYWAVPLMVLVAVWALEGGLPVLRSSFRSWDPRARNWRLAALAGCALVLGSSSAYFAVFSLLVIASAGITAAVRRWSFKPALAAGVVCAAIGAVLVANLLPELLHRAENGTNEETANRPASASEVWGLHIAQIVMPDVNHRIDALAKVGTRAADVPNPGEGGTYLGAVGVAGLGIGLLSLFGGRYLRRHDEGDRTEPLVHDLSVLAVIGILISTVGGFGFVLAVLGFSEIRSWGRFSVVLAFLALTIAAVAAEHALGRLRRPGTRQLAAAGVALVVAAGLVDQIPANATPHYDAIEPVLDSDRGFFGTLEEALPEGAMVFQLPAMQFPESPGVHNVGSYDHLRGYILNDTHLHWSSGGVTGRSADWQEIWASEPVPRMVEGLAAVGFSALYVDTAGYTDGGLDLLTQLNSLLGTPDGVAANQRMVWYDLRPVVEDMQERFSQAELDGLRAAVLESVAVEASDGLGAVEASEDGPFRWMSAEGSLVVENPGDARQLRMELVVAGPEGSTFVVEAGGRTRTFSLQAPAAAPDEPAGTPAAAGDGLAEVDVRFDVPAGRSTIRLRTDAPQLVVAGDSRDLRVQIRALSVTDPVLEDLLG